MTSTDWILFQGKGLCFLMDWLPRRHKQGTHRAVLVPFRPFLFLKAFLLPQECSGCLLQFHPHHWVPGSCLIDMSFRLFSAGEVCSLHDGKCSFATGNFLQF